MSSGAVSSTTDTPRVDTHLIKFSQTWVVALTALGFLFQAPALVVVCALCLIVSAAVPTIGPFRLLYRHAVVPLRLLKPRIVEDDPAPHRFAQAVGATFLVASSVVLLAIPSAGVAGWVLALIVFALALINLTVGFCAGCFVYYHLGRLGLMPRVRYGGGFHWRGA